MSITLRKIVHRDAYRIGVFFPFDQSVNDKLKSLGATYSKTKKCWYFDYSPDKYHLLKENFTDIIIDSPQKPEDAIKLVAGPERRDLPPIGAMVSPAKENREPKLPADPEKGKAWGHKAEEQQLAKKLKLRVLDNLGKYWILRMDYHKQVSQELLKIKGVYWNKQEKVYLVFRNKHVKEKVEAVLQSPGILPGDYVEKDQLAPGGTLTIMPHAENSRLMRVDVPRILMLMEKIKRIVLAKYSQEYKCFLLPASPEVFKALTLHYESEKLQIINQLPDGYLKKENMPNRKRILLESAKMRMIEKTPPQGREFMELLIDHLLANNSSDSTIRTYGHSFLRFIRDHDYNDPATLAYSEIVKYLGGLMAKGLSAPVGHNLVNALNYYYRNVEQNPNIAFKLPRPKREKKIRTVFTMAECKVIFDTIDNPKHRLALMVAYGAGLRVSEVVHLHWPDILFEEHKIHVHPVGLN